MATPMPELIPLSTGRFAREHGGSLSVDSITSSGLYQNGNLRSRANSPAFGKRAEAPSSPDRKESHSEDPSGKIKIKSPPRRTRQAKACLVNTRRHGDGIDLKTLLDGFPRDEGFANCGEIDPFVSISSWKLLQSHVFGTALLMMLVIQAFFQSLPYTFVRRKIRDPEQNKSSIDSEDGTVPVVEKDVISKDPRSYANSRGLDIEDEITETGDGFYLLLHHVVDPNRRREKSSSGYPILILHGLFQGSGSFITNGDKSLAFWLVRQGYDVWLGNLRTIHGMGHRTLGRDDPRFWAHNILDYARYDLPALVTYVCHATGHDKVAFIGHSQGSSVVFMALSKDMVPQLGERLSCVTALAPAVYAGPILSNYPFKQMRQLSERSWQRIFGLREFEPIMSWAYRYVPSRPFAAAGYLMFSSYFQWTDTNWVKGHRTHHFRFMPTTVSVKNVYWWSGDPDGFGCRGSILDDSLDQWFDERFPPLALFMGGIDYLVDGPRLVKRLETHEPTVKVFLSRSEPDNEHLDTFYGYRCVEETYKPLIAFVEQARQTGK